MSTRTGFIIGLTLMVLLAIALVILRQSVPEDPSADVDQPAQVGLPSA